MCCVLCSFLRHVCADRHSKSHEELGLAGYMHSTLESIPPLAHIPAQEVSRVLYLHSQVGHLLLNKLRWSVLFSINIQNNNATGIHKTLP